MFWDFVQNSSLGRARQTASLFLLKGLQVPQVYLFSALTTQCELEVLICRFGNVLKRQAFSSECVWVVTPGPRGKRLRFGHLLDRLGVEVLEG